MLHSGFLVERWSQVMDYNHSAFTTMLRSLFPTLCVWGSTWETSSSLYKDERFFVIFQKPCDEAGLHSGLASTPAYAPRSPLTHRALPRGMCQDSGGMYLPIQSQGVSYPAEILVLLTNNGRSLIYTKCLTFRQLQLAEANLTACWHLAITGVSTDLWPPERDLNSVSTPLSVPSLSATR